MLFDSVLGGIVPKAVGRLAHLANKLSPTGGVSTLPPVYDAALFEGNSWDLEQLPLHTDSSLRAMGARVLPPPLQSSQATLTNEAPTLQRPVILIHGLAQGAETFYPLKLYLCSNSENVFGGVFKPGVDEELVAQLERTPNAKVFCLDLPNHLAPPIDGEGIRGLFRLVDLVRQHTGHDEFDVVAHSMGGLVAREYLSHRGQGMRNLVKVTTWREI